MQTREPRFLARAALAGGCACLLLSGFAGLVYETIWTRLLAYTFSGTAVTSCLVLAAFMGGMAIGSGLAGRLAASSRAPLAAYAALEVGLAFCGLAYPALLRALGAWYLDLARASALGPSGLFVLKAAMFLGALAVPAILMGATLPFLVRLTVLDPARTGTTVGLLYAINSLGGVAGCLLGGFWMIPNLGLTVSSKVGAVANLGAATLAFCLNGWLILREVPAGQALAQQPAPAPAAIVPPMPAEGRPMIGIGTALLVSGFTAMTYEVLWNRTLPMVLGSSTYSFSLMVASFVAGITAGSLLFAVLGPRLGSPMRVLAGSQIAIALFVLATVPLYAYLPRCFVYCRALFGFGFAAYEATAVAINAAVMVVPALFFGLGFPAALQAAARSDAPGGTGVGEQAARHTGRLYALNTFGNVTGSLATGLLLIPGLGTPFTFQIAALFNLATGLALLIDASGGRASARHLAVVLVAVLLISPRASRDWLEVLAVGSYSRLRPRTWAEATALSEAARRITPEFLIEDSSTTAGTSVEDQTRALWVGGKTDASDSRDMVSQLLLAHCPLLMHPDPKRVFVLGLGAGVSAGAALAHPVEAVDCAEISAGVALAAHRFSYVNGEPWTDPRFSLAIDDGRHALSLSRRQYDVIVVEPSNPWMAGITSVYTREFLELCRDHLTKRGLVSQWTHLYETDPESFGLIARTFCAVFPHVRAFYLHRTLDLVMVGATDPQALADPGLTARIAQRMSRPAIAGRLARQGIQTTFTLLSQELFDASTLKVFARRGPLLSDDVPRLEFTAPVAYYLGTSIAPPYGLLPLRDSLLARYMAGRRPTVDELLDYGAYRLAESHPQGLGRLLAGPDAPRDARLQLLAARAYLAAREPSAALPLVRAACQERPTDLDAARLYYQAARAVEDVESGLLTPRAYRLSREALQMILKLEPGDLGALLEAAGLATIGHECEEAERILISIDPLLSRLPLPVSRAAAGRWAELGTTYECLGQRGKAFTAMSRALELVPNQPQLRAVCNELASSLLADPERR